MRTLRGMTGLMYLAGLTGCGAQVNVGGPAAGGVGAAGSSAIGATAGNAGATAGNAGATAGNAGATAGNAGATAGNAGATAGNAGATGRTPLVHRPVGVSCAPTPLPGEPQIPPASQFSPSATFDCQLNADCSAHSNGRCVVVPTNPPVDPGGTRCVYECMTDTDCAGSACLCGDAVSTCVAGDCRVDDDCGIGGFCSPSVDSCGALVGYFCHTTADNCIDERDCDAQQREKCIFNQTRTKYWYCAAVGCM